MATPGKRRFVKDEVQYPVTEEAVSKKRRSERRNDALDAIAKWTDVISTFKDKNGDTVVDVIARNPAATKSYLFLKRFREKLRNKDIFDPQEFWRSFDAFQETIAAECGESSMESSYVHVLRKNVAEGQDENGSVPGSSRQMRAPCQELLDSIVELQDADGRLLSECFQELPLRELYPDYYRVITEPIDLRVIQRKVKANEYTSIEDLEKDVMLLVKNAHTYNKPGSQIFKDATAIKKGFSSFKLDVEKEVMGLKSSKRIKSKRSFHYLTSSQSVDSDDSNNEDETQSSADQGRESTIPADPGNLMVMLYNQIVRYISEDGRCLAEPFLRLPSRRTYPDYYQVIKNPMALLRVKAKLLKGNQYTQLDVLAKDMELVFTNAQLYNEDDSQLHRDAVFLKTLLDLKLAELKKIEAITMDESAKLKVKEEVSASAKKRKAMDADPKNLKKKLSQLLSYVMTYKDSEGRDLSEMFLELPSAKEYPEYYSVIKQPIDLKIIESNIKNAKYTSEDAFIRDFELVFANAKEFNEEGSQIYEDAVTLEKLLKKKRRSIGVMPSIGVRKPSTVALEKLQAKQGNEKPPGFELSAKSQTPSKPSRAVTSPSSSKRASSGHVGGPPNHCQSLLSHIKSYKDNSKRHLCAIFDHLPPKSEYPDYYMLIKKPIDLTRISARVESNGYQNIDDLEQDLLLMFDNACRYNEPDSQVYKDALTLQREMLTKKAQLIGEDGYVVPDVQHIMQTMLLGFYNSLMQHNNNAGKCCSEFLIDVKVPMMSSGDGPCDGMMLSLPVIGQLLKKGFYRRLDHFQEDIFRILRAARENSTVDSEVFEASSRLQSYFITERDQHCKGGERITTQALSYTKRQLTQEIEQEKEEKRREDGDGSNGEDNDETGDGDDGDDDTRKQEDIFEIIIQDAEQLDTKTEYVHEGETYRAGDFVYIEAKETSLKPHVVYVDKVWKHKDPMVIPQHGFHCCWFYRPEETYHTASKKFLPQEVFKSDHYSHLSFTKIVGRCHVVAIKDYMKSKPENFDESDYFACESRYNRRTKQFSKIKQCTWVSPHVVLATRPEAIVPLRVASVFTTARRANGGTQDPQMDVTAMDIDSLEEMRRAVFNSEDQDIESDTAGQLNYTFYEQLKTQTGTYKIGDSVYVRSDEEYPYMARIDKIWINGKDGVAHFHGNWFLRPEEAKHMPTRMFYEQEVFQSNIDDTNPMASIMGKCCILHIKDYVMCRPTEISERDVYICESRYDEGDGHIRKLKGLKRPLLSANVRDDEFYYFETPLTPKKKPSPWLVDKAPAVVTPKPEVVEVESTDDTKKLQGERKIREQAGFALFTAEVGAAMRRRRAAATDQEVERIANNEWRGLNGAKRAEYEARGRAQDLESSQPDDGSLLVYECGWISCDHQYEDIQDLMVHVMESGGHLAKGENNEFPCSWQDCVRVKKGLPPFPTYSKLARHIREVHFKVAAKRILSFEKSRSYFPRHQAAEHSSSSRDSQYADHVTSRVGLPPVPALYASSPGGVPPVSLVGIPQIQGQPGMSAFRMVSQQQQMQQQQQQQQQQQPVVMQRPGMMADGSAPMMQHGQVVGAPLQQPLTIEQQQMLIQQVQLQQQQIQKLTHQLAAQSSGYNVEAEPVFVAPPPNTRKLRHSEAYLRYIEGLRDNKQHMSQWSEANATPITSIPPGAQPVPVMWLGGRTFGYNSSTETLVALRDHMLRDSVAVPQSK